MFETVAIVGVGLIGGSLGIPRRASTIAEALSVGAIDDGTLELSAVAEADLVVLAPPVLTIPPLVEAMAGYLRPGTIVTDVGSTKSALMTALLPLLPEHVHLVGGHPMAGSEQGGVLAGRADLFENAIWVLTRPDRTPESSVARLAELVRNLGARPIEMEPNLHDAAVARISHLPHVAAAALAAATPADGLPLDLLRLLVAGGFRSTTRIAASPPEMWRDICLTNRDAILEALGDFESALAGFRTALAEASPEALYAAFADGKTARDELVPPTPPPNPS